jgi:hypothetical protein
MVGPTEMKVTGTPPARPRVYSRYKSASSPAWLVYHTLAADDGIAGWMAHAIVWLFFPPSMVLTEKVDPARSGRNVERNNCAVSGQDILLGTRVERQTSMSAVLANCWYRILARLIQ